MCVLVPVRVNSFVPFLAKVPVPENTPPKLILELLSNVNVPPDESLTSPVPDKLSKVMLLLTS